MLTIHHTGTGYYYVKKLQGDITMLVDENGSVAARYTYDHQGALASVKDNSGTVITSADHIANILPAIPRLCLFKKFPTISFEKYERFINNLC